MGFFDEIRKIFKFWILGLRIFLFRIKIELGIGLPFFRLSKCQLQT